MVKRSWLKVCAFASGITDKRKCLSVRAFSHFVSDLVHWCVRMELSAFWHNEENGSTLAAARNTAYGPFLFLLIPPPLCPGGGEGGGRTGEAAGITCGLRVTPERWPLGLFCVWWELWTRTFELLSNFLLRHEHWSVSWNFRLLFVVGCFPATVPVVYRLPECSELLCWIQWLSSRRAPLPYPPSLGPLGNTCPAVCLLLGLASFPFQAESPRESASTWSDL